MCSAAILFQDAAQFKLSAIPWISGPVLQRLAVISIGIDTSTQHAGARLMPYRGFTHAQLMAAVVNETVDDGWFAFLRRIERDQELDAAGPIMI